MAERSGPPLLRGGLLQRDEPPQQDPRVFQGEGYTWDTQPAEGAIVVDDNAEDEPDQPSQPTPFG